MKKIARKNLYRNPRKNGSDKAIRDILLTVTNDATFYRQVLLPTQKGLGRKLYKGKFTRASAMKAFITIANLADKFYNSTRSAQQRGTWRQTKGYSLSVEERKRLAAALLEDSMEAAQYYADEMQEGIKYKDLKNNPRKRKNSSLTFKDVKVGGSFYYDGQLFVKKSSRTAYVFGRPSTSIFFKNADPVESDEKQSRKKAYGVRRKQLSNPKKRSMAMPRKRNPMKKNFHHNPRRRRRNAGHDVVDKLVQLICHAQDEETLKSAAELILAMSPVYPEYAVYKFNRITFYDFEDPEKDIPEFVDYLIGLFQNHKNVIYIHVIGDKVVITCLTSGTSEYSDLIAESPARRFNTGRKRRRNTAAKKAVKRKNTVKKKNPIKRKNTASAAQKKAQANAKKAMKLYQSGEARTLKAAWKMVKNPKKNPRRRRR